jgi:transglutaminase-like putative cysteine protease/predicted glutamine amidotransferase
VINPRPLHSDVLAISLDGRGSPSIKINLSNKSDSNGQTHNWGWGFACYPDDNQSAMVSKDPAARSTQVSVESLIDWSKFRSTVFFTKIKGANQGYSYKETQPFSRSFAGLDWIFMHNGDLDKKALDELHGKKTRLLEPLGKTDSELAFVELLANLQENGARRISDVKPRELHSWFQRFDSMGGADMYLSDGYSIVCFQGSQSPKQLYFARLQPPESQLSYESEATHIVLDDPRDTYRTALIVSSSPFSSGEWTPMQPGQMIIIRRGAIIWDSHPKPLNKTAPAVEAPVQRAQVQQKQTFHSATQAEQTQEHVLNARGMSQTPEGAPLNYRLYEVTHGTHYNYTEAVEHSTHFFRLQPTDDLIQEVVYTKLTISSPTEEVQFEDVFGNQAIHCTISKPYSQLSVEATSRVKVYARPSDDYSLSRRQSTIPLVWMPWQRQMMMSYLLPPELPESQLTELTEYAMSFVERNDYQLLNTIEDFNLSIYRDYKYVPGSTSLNTTPFEVYTSREGVCQDFANLLICLARLLNIPARYRMGYIYTGANYANKIQSDASHAWVEVYLPYVGWRGFDPTNGCKVSQDHIRVACGRNYIDATPTSGTIYKGGGMETLTVDVKMREVHE